MIPVIESTEGQKREVGFKWTGERLRRTCVYCEVAFVNRRTRLVYPK
jgi:hypothetical protein